METKKTFVIASMAVGKRIKKAMAVTVRVMVGVVMVAGMAGMVGGLVGCSQARKVTKLEGTIEGDGINEVNIAVVRYAIDTLVPVVDGKFSIDLPADPTEVAFISADQYDGYFILDGTQLTLKFGENSSVVSKSQKSLQNEYNVFEANISKKTSEFQSQILAFLQDETLTAEKYTARYREILDAATGSIVTYVEQVVMNNRDNAIGALAVNKLSGMVDDETLFVMLGTLSDRMQEGILVAPLRQEVEVRLSSAEGMPFKDFTVEDSDGRTVSLSDYVGRGEYVLVDFWASWCQPCREEVPYIKAAYEKFHHKGFDVVSVAIADDPQDSKDAAKELGMNWNLIINAGELPADVYGFSTIPQIMLFGPDGTILKKGLRGEDISEEIGKYIE